MTLEFAWQIGEFEIKTNAISLKNIAFFIRKTHHFAQIFTTDPLICKANSRVITVHTSWKLTIRGFFLWASPILVGPKYLIYSHLSRKKCLVLRKFLIFLDFETSCLYKYNSTTVRFWACCYEIQQMAFFQLAALYCRWSAVQQLSAKTPSVGFQNAILFWREPKRPWCLMTCRYYF